jgi:hypothetical protein
MAKNFYSVFGSIERFSENKIVPCSFGTAEISIAFCTKKSYMFRFKNDCLVTIPNLLLLPPAPWSGRTVESIFGAGVEIC